jgi:hypothetical protein
MNDRNGTPLAVGARVRFHFDLRGHGTWLDGTVRLITEHTYYRPTVTVSEALVDNGDPGNADLQTNGWNAAAWLGADNIEMLAGDGPTHCVCSGVGTCEACIAGQR